MADNFTHYSFPAIFRRILITILTLFTSTPLSSPQNLTTSSDAICNLTPHPDFCKSQLPHYNSTSLNAFGRICLQKSLSRSNKFLSTANSYLKSKQLNRSRSTVFVLQDCKFLLRSNVDFLSSVLRIARSGDVISNSASDDGQSLLSAVMTNHQTCWDQLNVTPSAANISYEFSPSLAAGSLLYSVSLAVFKLGWRGGRAYLPPSPRGVGSVKIRKAVVVNRDGTGDYRTIKAAVAAAPDNAEGGEGYYVIRVGSGVYEEYVDIGRSKKYVMMIGEGINKTIITGNRSVVDGWTTFDSATFGVSGDGFVGINLTIRNTAGPAKHQAVAVRNNADFSAFYKCSFEAYQDTLFAHSLRQFYRECNIYGTVDFIFGNAAAVLQNCNVYARRPMQGQFNVVTAQGRTDINQNTGISFHNCTVAPAVDLASAGNSLTAVATFLGRPWKEYSRTVYIRTFLGGLISPAGWSLWIGDFALKTLYYAEYQNSGPGSGTANRVSWPGYHRTMMKAEAESYTVSKFVAGDRWVAAAGVPYVGGLI